MKLRLSEAIRLGSMLKPKGTGLLSVNCAAPAVCAMGAAALAAGLKPVTSHQPVIDEWPWIETLKVASPVSGGSPLPVVNVIYALNDFYGWTREEIADYVQTIEPQETAIAQPAEAEAVHA